MWSGLQFYKSRNKGKEEGDRARENSRKCWLLRHVTWNHIELLCVQPAHLGMERETNLPSGSCSPLFKIYSHWLESKASMQIWADPKIQQIGLLEYLSQSCDLKKKNATIWVTALYLWLVETSLFTLLEQLSKFQNCL